MGLDQRPELIVRDSIVAVDLVWRTVHGRDSGVHPATNGVLVVSVSLGEGFLSDSSPNGAILAESSENRGAASLERKPIIDNLGERNTESVHLDGVDTVVGELVGDEEVIDSTWDFSDG